MWTEQDGHLPLNDLRIITNMLSQISRMADKKWTLKQNFIARNFLHEELQLVFKDYFEINILLLQ
jgi:hypothetical protein